MPSSSSHQSKTLNLDSTILFLKSTQSTSPPPLSFSLLSSHSPLPPIPTDFPVPKLIPKTKFIVDGFRFSGDYSVSYFLSHFHSDHYGGLNANWSRGIIFCSPITARLVVQFLFKIPTENGIYERYVHTGDFRYCSSMTSETVLNEFIGADAVFLDTTYCNPKYVFPSQEESIDYVVNVINKYMVENEGDAKTVGVDAENLDGKHVNKMLKHFAGFG
ncbi:hypothetical protein R6Q59_024765 [Mikania micrantha]